MRRRGLALLKGRYLRLLTTFVPENARIQPWSRVEGKSQVNLPQMSPLRSGICLGVDFKTIHLPLCCLQGRGIERDFPGTKNARTSHRVPEENPGDTTPCRMAGVSGHPTRGFTPRKNAQCGLPRVVNSRGTLLRRGAVSGCRIQYRGTSLIRNSPPPHRITIGP